MIANRVNSSASCPASGGNLKRCSSPNAYPAPLPPLPSPRSSPLFLLYALLPSSPSTPSLLPSSSSLVG
ncbi:MAG: hypothetical protein LBU37_11910 [Tannerellaceae bacterium]|nr:hypothetical protein [Tannerellaceae bacterium]